MSANID